MDNGTSIIELDGRKARLLAWHKKNSDYNTQKQQVFIIGSKGIPANYGGFETFVEKLTEYQRSGKIRYHVARIGDKDFRYEYNGAKCFNLSVPKLGPAKAVYYDLKALKWCIGYCKARPSIKRPVFYVLACRIGPFIGYYKRQIRKLGGVIYVNPDGHEWMRQKWSPPVRKYWKCSEKLMVKHADLLICDSKNIEKYIQTDYKQYHPKTTFIAYGSDMTPSSLADDDPKLSQWYGEKGLTAKEYYLVVGRFVPENNFETIIREFMASSSKRDLAIITTANEALLERLEKHLHFKSDNRIKFVGTVYDQNLLKKVRENAYGYLHGHEVGGTNPSLIEALGSTELNLLLDVGFNREVGEDGALYWDKSDRTLAKMIDRAEAMNSEEVSAIGVKAKKRVADYYTWNYIVGLYENLFLEAVNK